MSRLCSPASKLQLRRHVTHANNTQSEPAHRLVKELRVVFVDVVVVLCCTMSVAITCPTDYKNEISLYIITTFSNVHVMRIKEMIA